MKESNQTNKNNRLRGAKRTKNDDIAHVMPVGDLRQHIASLKCWCNPTSHEDLKNVFLHHAMDEREKYETGEKKPS